MIHTYAVNIKDFPITYLNALYDKLPPDRAVKLQRFHHLADTLRGITGDILTRVVLSEILHMPVYALKFSTNFYGKPSLIGFDEKIGYNVSHAGDWVTLAINSSGKVGVDIEEITTTDLETAKRFFAEEEYVSITSRLEDDDQSLHFYEVWTAKESYIKAVGKGLSIPLDSFSTVTGNEMARVKRVDNLDWYFQRTIIDQRYIVTTCVDVDHLWEKIKILDIKLIIDDFLNFD
jgi:4'-phosphopantetheinyl transferase